MFGKKLKPENSGMEEEEDEMEWPKSRRGRGGLT
jgi:hypothetical protein